MPEVGKIWIKVTPDLRGFWTKLKEALEEAEHEEVKIKMGLDSTDFREKVKAEAKAASEGSSVKIKTKLDKSDFAKTLAEVKAAAKAADTKIDVGFRDKEAEAHLTTLIAKLKAEARLAKIKLKVETEHGEGRAGLLSRVGSGLGSMGSELSSGIGAGFSAMRDNTVMIAVAITSLLAPALSMLAQVIVGLPALVGAVALPVGVFALGLGGIKKALDDSGILEDVAGKKGKDKQGLGASIKKVQQDVSDVFEKGFTPLFRQVAAAIPGLTRGLPFVAQGIVDLAAGVTKAVTSPAFIQGFDRFTNSVSTMMTKLAPGLQAFTTGLANLTFNVGDHLPGLGNVMTGWASRFNNWVTSISKPKQFWGKDIPGSSILDSAITNLKPILNSIIDFIGKLMDAGLKLAADPKMADNIKTVVDKLGSFIKEGLPDLAGFFDSFAKLLKQFHGNKNTDGLPGDQPDRPKLPRRQQDQANGDVPGSSNSFFPGIKQGSPLAKLGEFGPEFERRISDVNGKILQGFKDIPGKVGKFFDEAASISGKALQGIVKVADTVGQDIVNIIKGIPGKLGDFGSALLHQGEALMDGLLKGIRAGLSKVLDFAKGIAGEIAKVKGPLPKDRKELEPAGQALMAGLQDGLEGGFAGVLGRAKTMAQQLADAIASGKKIDPGLYDQTKSDLQALTDESKQLSEQRSGLKGKGNKGARDAITSQLAEIKSAREALTLQEQRGKELDKTIPKQKKQTDMADQLKESMGTMASNMASSVANFGTANMHQFETDLGMGGGAITSIADQMIGWGTQFMGGALSSMVGGKGKGDSIQGDTHIHVNSVEEGLQADRHLTARKQLTQTGGGPGRG